MLCAALQINSSFSPKISAIIVCVQTLIVRTQKNTDPRLILLAVLCPACDRTVRNKELNEEVNSMENEKQTREELEEKIMEQLDELSLEDLEKVAGGGLFDILKEIGKGSWKEENP